MEIEALRDWRGNWINKGKQADTVEKMCSGNDNLIGVKVYAMLLDVNYKLQDELLQSLLFMPFKK